MLCVLIMIINFLTFSKEINNRQKRNFFFPYCQFCSTYRELMGAVVVVWSYGSWIYYLCNQCLLPLMLWVRISIRVRCTTLCDKVCQWLATGRWFSLGPPVSSTNKTDRHDITEILLKVALNTIKQNNINGQLLLGFGGLNCSASFSTSFTPTLTLTLLLTLWGKLS